MLQLDPALLAAVQAQGFQAAIETNGTLAVVPGLDWVCVSTKAGAPLVVTSGDELKVVYPQPGLDLDQLAALPFRLRWLSPMDGPAIDENMAAAAAFCRANPVWRLNIQAHKVWGIR
jgi:organic radical activating enzyme